MTNLLLTLAPFLIIFLSSIIVIGSPSKIKYKSLFTFLGLIIALIFNLLLAIFKVDAPIVNSFFIQKDITLLSSVLGPYSHYYIQAIIIAISIVIFIRFSQKIYDIHSADFFISFYLLFTASIMGFFLSENLLIISLFFILASISLEFLFYYDLIEKKFSKIGIVFIIISSGILITTDLLVQIVFKTLVLSEIIQTISQSSNFVQFVIFLGYFFGFGSLGLILPLINLHYKIIFQKSNPIYLSLLSSIFNPIVGLILLKIYILIPFDNRTITHFIFLVGCIGFSLSSIQLIVEIFELNPITNGSVQNLIGLLSSVEFSIFILFGGLIRLPILLNQLEIQRSIFIFFILSVFTKSILVEILQPTFKENVKTEWNWDHLSGKFYHKIFFVIVMLFVPIFYAIPGFLGYKLFLNILKPLNSNLYDSALYFAEFWTIIILIVLFESILMILVGKTISQTYFQKSLKEAQRKKQKIRKIDYIAPILLIVSSLIMLIFL
ncbi:MAG: hypothetical protein ACTSW5_03020 [Promethearchaeota archaeon]